MVTDEPVREGETVVQGIQNTNGSTFMTMADMSVVTAEVKVDETDIVNVRLGQPADVTVDAIPNKIFKGHVTLGGRPGAAALHRRGHIAVHHRHGRSQGLQGGGYAGQPERRAPAGTFVTTAKIMTAHKSDVLALPIQALTIKPQDTQGRQERQR